LGTPVAFERLGPRTIVPALEQLPWRTIVSISGEQVLFQHHWNNDFDLAVQVHRLLHAGESDIYRKASEVADRVILETILRHTHGNQVQASLLLGISRTTLRAKMKALRMIVKKQLLPEADMR
jgi:DNA-binding NtrC family response regulator